MKYEFVDYRNLVSMWYNEFLPEAYGDSILSYKDAGILYLNSISLEPRKKESILFLIGKIKEMNKETTKVFVLEPKPVNNPRVQKFLSFVEESKTISEERKNKIFHLANIRCSVSSKDILITQDKEIGEFLDQTFLVLSKLNLPNCRFYSSHLPFSDTIECAKSFFPRKSLSIQGNYSGKYITISSTNSMLDFFSSVLSQQNSAGNPFVDQAMKSMRIDFEKLV